jgi:hypothetical protein
MTSFKPNSLRIQKYSAFAQVAIIGVPKINRSFSYYFTPRGKKTLSKIRNALIEQKKPVQFIAVELLIKNNSTLFDDEMKRIFCNMSADNYRQIKVRYGNNT